MAVSDSVQDEGLQLIAIASVLLLFACSKDSKEIPESGSAETGLDIALAIISRENIQSSLNYLAADEREGRMTGSRGYDESAQYVAENLGTQPNMSWIDEGGDVADFHPELQGDAMFSRHSAEQLFEGSPLTFEEALDAADEARPSSIAMEEQRPTWNEGDFFGQKFGNRP